MLETGFGEEFGLWSPMRNKTPKVPMNIERFLRGCWVVDAMGKALQRGIKVKCQSIGRLLLTCEHIAVAGSPTRIPCGVE